MKQFTNEKYVSNYLADIRTKIPGYDLMFELVFDSIIPLYLNKQFKQSFLLVGGGLIEIDYIQKKYSSSSLTIIDSSQEMINVYKEKLNDTSVKLITNKFEDCNLNKKFTLCISLLVLHFINDKEIFLKKAYDSLVDDGFLIVSTFSNYHLDWWREFSVSRGADSYQIDFAINTENEYMNILEVKEIEAILLDTGFNKVEKISQILCIDLWIAFK